jgi:hypothetical protein
MTIGLLFKTCTLIFFAMEGVQVCMASATEQNPFTEKYSKSEDPLDPAAVARHVFTVAHHLVSTINFVFVCIISI